MAAQDLSTLILTFITHSKDAYAIMDPQDRVVFCNTTFEDMFCFKLSTCPGVTFADTIRQAFQVKRGVNIDADNIEAWLKEAEQKRRSRDFRIFEVDLVDGRWMLFSEQMLEDGSLMVHGKNMTRQKVLESQLVNSVTTLKHMAMTDELTGLANRRAFKMSVQSEIQRLQAQQTHSALLLLDLDHFKQINDTYGHQGGDKVLKEVAFRLKHCLRSHDIIGRIGGEEFAIFLGNTTLEQTQKMAERVRHCVADTPVQFEHNNIVVTTSIGLILRPANSSLEEMYQLADIALYQAKSLGRNRVELAV